MVLLVISLPVCFASELNLVYDANGNLVTGDGLFREYDGLNQLVRVRNGSTSTSPLLEEFVHHPIEERILLKKVYNANDGSLKEKVIYVSKTFVKVVNSSGTFDFTYVYHEGQLVAQQNPDGSKIFIHVDHLGSSSVVTNGTGTVIENTSYEPFGEVLTGGTRARFGYEAKEHDTTVGDTDFNFRKYNPSWGLFLQPDTLLPNVYNPQQLNRYSFELNNPQKNTDPTGHCPICLIAGAAFVIGSVYYLATHEGSGWSNVAHAYAAGGIAAGAVLGSYAFVTGVGTAAGTAPASSGADAVLTAGGNFLVGAGAEVATEVNENEDFDSTDVLIAGVTNVPTYRMGMKPGTYMGNRL
ncbi:hypothetical protein HZB03_00925, partial [Candidatus Woesearchaeota archaeon]|nr:hypothetical protein [Candidatus Woesearchaeota archaeon]